jgi:hypothetical protein
MNTIINAMPQPRILGIQDLSGTTPVYETTPVPTHLPLFMILAQKGSPDAQLLSGDAIVETYGAETFNPRGKFYNHQTAFLDKVRGKQAVMVKRIEPSDIGPPSRLLLSLDIVDELIPQYERLTDGSFKLDQQGARIPTGSTVPGYKAKWVLNDWVVGTGPNASKAFGQMTQKTGTLTNASSDQSVRYPIAEFQVSSRGSFGDNLGLRLSAPTTTSTDAIDATMVERLKARLYRFQFIERASATSTGVAVPSNNGDQYVDLSFAAGLFDEKTNSEVSVEDVLLQSYQRIGTPGVPDQVGPFSAMHIYEANLKEVLAMVGAAEAPLGILAEDVLTMDEDSEFLHLVNIFTGTNIDGVQYGALQLLGPTDGGTYLSENTSLYATGGTDGTTSLAQFGTDVKAWLDSWGTSNSPMLDWARYPLSCMYDSGFPLEAKYSFFIPMSKRPDVWVTVVTQDASLPLNTASEDSSIAVALRARAAAYPEAVLYGTSVTRALIIGQGGTPLNTTYKNKLPLAWTFAGACADYMGASDGKWIEQANIELDDNKIITEFRDVNNSFKPSDSRQADWATGLIWAQYYDHKSLYFPAFQTVYDDDSSVLNSAVNMFAAVEAIKAAQRSWRKLVGRSDLTPAQVIKENNANITADLDEGRFHGRFTIVPETFYTGADTQRGYSYSCRINILAPNMITVGSFTIAMYRKDTVSGA